MAVSGSTYVVPPAGIESPNLDIERVFRRRYGAQCALKIQGPLGRRDSLTLSSAVFCMEIRRGVLDFSKTVKRRGVRATASQRQNTHLTRRVFRPLNDVKRFAGINRRTRETLLVRQLSQRLLAKSASRYYKGNPR